MGFFGTLRRPGGTSADQGASRGRHGRSRSKPENGAAPARSASEGSAAWQHMPSREARERPAMVKSESEGQIYHKASRATPWNSLKTTVQQDSIREGDIVHVPHRQRRRSFKEIFSRSTPDLHEGLGVDDLPPPLPPLPSKLLSAASKDKLQTHVHAVSQAMTPSSSQSSAFPSLSSTQTSAASCESGLSQTTSDAVTPSKEQVSASAETPRMPMLPLRGDNGPVAAFGRRVRKSFKGEAYSPGSPDAGVTMPAEVKVAATRGGVSLLSAAGARRSSPMPVLPVQKGSAPPDSVLHTAEADRQTRATTHSSEGQGVGSAVPSLHMEAQDSSTQASGFNGENTTSPSEPQPAIPVHAPARIGSTRSARKVQLRIHPPPSGPPLRSTSESDITQSRRTSAYFSAKSTPTSGASPAVLSPSAQPSSPLPRSPVQALCVSPTSLSPQRSLSPTTASPASSSSFGCSGPLGGGAVPASPGGSLATLGRISPRNLSYGAKLCLEHTLARLRDEGPASPAALPERLNTAFGRAYPSSTRRSRPGTAYTPSRATAVPLAVTVQRTRLLLRLERRRVTLMEEVELEGFKRLLGLRNDRVPEESLPSLASAMVSATGAATMAVRTLNATAGEDRSAVSLVRSPTYHQPMASTVRAGSPDTVMLMPQQSPMFLFKQLQEQAWKRWCDRPPFAQRMVVIFGGGSGDHLRVGLVSTESGRSTARGLEISARAMLLSGRHTISSEPADSGIAVRCHSHVADGDQHDEQASRDSDVGRIDAAAAAATGDESDARREHHGQLSTTINTREALHQPMRGREVAIEPHFRRKASIALLAKRGQGEEEEEEDHNGDGGLLLPLDRSIGDDEDAISTSSAAAVPSRGAGAAVSTAAAMPSSSSSSSRSSSVRASASASDSTDSGPLVLPAMEPAPGAAAIATASGGKSIPSKRFSILSSWWNRSSTQKSKLARDPAVPGQQDNVSSTEATDTSPAPTASVKRSQASSHDRESRPESLFDPRDHLAARDDIAGPDMAGPYPRLHPGASPQSNAQRPSSHSSFEPPRRQQYPQPSQSQPGVEAARDRPEREAPPPARGRPVSQHIPISSSVPNLPIARNVAQSQQHLGVKLAPRPSFHDRGASFPETDLRRSSIQEEDDDEMRFVESPVSDRSASIPHRKESPHLPSPALSGGPQGEDDDEEVPLAFLKRDRVLNASEDSIVHGRGRPMSTAGSFTANLPRSASTSAVPQADNRRSLLLAPPSPNGGRPLSLRSDQSSQRRSSYHQPMYDSNGRPVSTALSDYAADELQRLQAEVYALKQEQAKSAQLQAEVARLQAAEAQRAKEEGQRLRIKEEEERKQREEEEVKRKRDERKRWEDHRRRSAMLDSRQAPNAGSGQAQNPDRRSSPMSGMANSASYGTALHQQAGPGPMLIQPQPIYPEPFVHPGFYSSYPPQSSTIGYATAASMMAPSYSHSGVIRTGSSSPGIHQPQPQPQPQVHPHHVQMPYLPPDNSGGALMHYPHAFPYSSIPTPPATPPRYPSPARSDSPNRMSGIAYNGGSGSPGAGTGAGAAQRMSGYFGAAQQQQQQQQQQYQLQSQQQPQQPHGLINYATSPAQVDAGRPAGSGSGSSTAPNSLSRSQGGSSGRAHDGRAGSGSGSGPSAHSAGTPQRRSVSFANELAAQAGPPVPSKQQQQQQHQRQHRSASSSATPDAAVTANRGSRAFLDMPRSRTSYFQA